MKQFRCTIIHVFMPSFVEIHNVEVNKLVRGIHDKK